MDHDLQDAGKQPPSNLICAADHNSIIVPSRDAAGPTTQNELPAILAARSEEIWALSQLNLCDAWTACTDPDIDGGGWTWGFPPPSKAAAPPLCARWRVVS